MAYDNNNRGSLFRNEGKTEERFPDYTGSADIGGKEYRIAGWIRKTKGGKTYMSLAFNEAQS